MKIAILAAGGSKYFPLFIDRPKCLYHLDGQVQLARVINVAKKFVPEEDIIVVGGYKYKYIEKYLQQNYPKVDFRVNNRYDEAAIYSFRVAVENVDDDIVIMFGDENIAEERVAKICESKKELAVMCHDTYYYYSLGIMKLAKNNIHMFFDDNYLSMDYMKDIYCFANNKTIYDGDFDINSGICIGYMMIDIIRKVGKIDKIQNPNETYHGEEIEFIHFDPSKEYVPDIDHICATDEYKNNILLKIYTRGFSDPLKKIINLFRSK